MWGRGQATVQKHVQTLKHTHSQTQKPIKTKSKTVIYKQKIYKLGRKARTKNITRQKPPKTLLSSLCLEHLLLDAGLLFCIVSDTPFGEN